MASRRKSSNPLGEHGQAGSDGSQPYRDRQGAAQTSDTSGRSVPVAVRLATTSSHRQNVRTMNLTPHPPAINVVVFRFSGPEDDRIEKLSADFVERKTVCPLGGGLGYLVLQPDDFDRVWAGVDAGDAFGTADAVLYHLGPDVRQFMHRSEDFIYGWVGADDEPEFERVLLLQVVPRPHLVEMMKRRAEQN